MESVIKLDSVSFSYQNAPVLEDATVEVKRGEFIGIFGPNGGGKTTLLKLIMGFLTPNSGVIEVFGTTPIASQRKMAYVPQAQRFDREFPISVEELVLSGRLRHLPWHGNYLLSDIEKAYTVIEKVGLKNMENRAVGTLSGGQAQRALIARALISEPELLLLDEPTASVDLDAEAEIYGYLEEIRGNVTILMVTHHLHTAINQVERVLLVRKHVNSLDTEEVCEHFALGLYHAPLVKDKNPC